MSDRPKIYLMINTSQRIGADFYFWPRIFLIYFILLILVIVFTFENFILQTNIDIFFFAFIEFIQQSILLNPLVPTNPIKPCNLAKFITNPAKS